MLEALTASAPEEPFNAKLAVLPACLQKLAPQARRILGLFYEQEYKPQQIARLVDWSPAAVSVARIRLHARYAALLQRAGRSADARREEAIASREVDSAMTAGHFGAELSALQRLLRATRRFAHASVTAAAWPAEPTSPAIFSVAWSAARYSANCSIASGGSPVLPA